MKRGSEMQRVLEDNILGFWSSRMVDTKHGGFYGRIDGQGRLIPEAPKGAVLNARILWAFSAAYRVLGKEEYKNMALRAKDYIFAHFIDSEHGGVYWMLDHEGHPLDTKKQTYAQGFMIYGLSELFRATGDEDALRLAVQLFEDMERYAFDSEGNGYIEALSREWSPLADMRLSEKDENGSRTMNTHLHILEPYTNLYRVWKDQRLRSQLRNLVTIFTEKILNPATGHLDLFFDDHWHSPRDKVSYGHDIEAAWLLTEALDVLGDEALTAQTLPLIPRIAHAAEEGLMSDGSMAYEGGDEERHWWVQCECIIGELFLWQRFGDASALDRARRCWDFVRQRLIDWQGGEWFWSIGADDAPNLTDDKAGPWKCPYHNSRMCLNVISICAGSPLML